MESQLTILEQETARWREILETTQNPPVEQIDFDRLREVLNSIGEICRRQKKLEEEYDFVRHWLTVRLLSRRKAVRLLAGNSISVGADEKVEQLTLSQLIEQLEDISSRLRQMSGSSSRVAITQHTWENIRTFKA